MELIYPAYFYLRGLISEKRGEIKLSMIVVGAILLVAFMAYPQPVYSFIHYIKNMVFSELHKHNFHSGSHHGHTGAHHPSGTGQGKN